MLLLGYALAALIGLSLGLMGGGGSILTVPIFVYVLKYDPKLAIVMSLPVIGITSLVGAVEYWRTGSVDLKTALTFGVFAMSGAYAGAHVAALISGAMQLILLAVVMVAAAILMLRSPVLTEANEPGRPASFTLLLPIAVAVGLLTGLIGTGGGFLVVPALVILGRVPMKQAVGTSLLVIAMNCASGFVGYIGHVDVPWAFLLGFTAVAVVGILVGARLVKFVSQRALKRAFAVFMLIMAVFILAKNRRAFDSTAARTSDLATPVPLLQERS